MSILFPSAQSCCGAELPVGREPGRKAAPQQRLSEQKPNKPFEYFSC